MSGRSARWVGLASLAAVLAACGALGGGGDDRKTLTIFGPYRDADADGFVASMAEFEAQTGLAVRYTGTAQLDVDLRQRLADGLGAPDIAIVPQPGLVDDLAAAQQLVPLDAATQAAVRRYYENGAPGIESAYAAPYRLTVKSLVWYRPDVFEAHGWEVPTTMDQLVALAEAVSRDGSMAPWCFTMEAGAATGWPASDWLEDLVLRDAGAEGYDRWVDGDLHWASKPVTRALTALDELLLAPGQTHGGVRDMLQVQIERGGLPLFDDQPGCALYKQADFAAGWFPDGTLVGSDVDFFVLPGTSAQDPAPVVVGGDQLVQFSSDPDVSKLMQYLVSPEGGRAWAQRGGYLSARTSVDVDDYYADPTDQRLAKLLLDGRPVRFDASDALPVEIGSDLEWAQLTSWVAGSITRQELAATMDRAMRDAP